MSSHHAPPLGALDFIAPVLIAGLFVIVMSLVKEPARQRFNAVFVAGAGAAYLSSGLGGWEFAFCAVVTALAYRGLTSYRAIGLAWLLHTCWDVLHHLYADPIVPFAPTSSAGCAITDALLAVWFWLGAPSLLAASWLRWRGPPEGGVTGGTRT